MTLLEADEVRGLVALARRVRGRASERGGAVTSTRLGRGFEQHGHDPYRPGDDPRHLDWRARIRTGGLWVRRYRAEGDGGVRVVVDDSASIAGARREVAARVAAGLAVVATAAALPIAIDGLGGGAERATLDAAGARRSLARVAELAAVPRRVELPGALARAARATHPDEQVVVVSDLADPAPPDILAASVARLARRVACVHLIDGADATLGDADEVIDPETGARRVAGAAARARFAETVATWQRQVFDALSAHEIEVHVVDVANPPPLVDLVGELAAHWS